MITLLLTLELERNIMLEYHKTKVLNAISQVESRNCQNVKHKVMKKGIHKGDSAQGCYGIMPKTSKMVLNRFKIKSNGMTSLSNENTFKLIFNQDYVMASKYYDILNKKYQGNTEKVIYSWLNGSVNKKYSKKHWYIKRVMDKME